RERRETERADRRAEAAHIEALDAAVRALEERTDLMARAALTAAGYHQHHRGGWRKRRGQQLADQRQPADRPGGTPPTSKARRPGGYPGPAGRAPAVAAARGGGPAGRGSRPPGGALLDRRGGGEEPRLPGGAVAQAGADAGGAGRARPDAVGAAARG